MYQVIIVLDLNNRITAVKATIVYLQTVVGFHVEGFTLITSVSAGDFSVRFGSGSLKK